MLSEKQFRERAKTELRQVADQVLSLATDCDIYWKLEREVIQPNPQLRQVRNEFLDMLRGSYTDAMVARMLRLLDDHSEAPSLPRLLQQLAHYPDLLQDKITEREFTDDRAALERTANTLQRTMAPHFAHHERTLSALASTHRELDAAIDLMIATVKTYYWIIADSYLNLDVNYAADPLSIFRFPWATPVLAT